MPLLAAGLAFAVAFLLLLILVRWLGHVGLDRPNDRSLHERPVPRTGGLAILAALGVALSLGALAAWPALILALLLAAVSLLDDLFGMRTGWRLAAHFAAACVLVWYVLSPMHPVEMLVLVLAVTWMTNLYNFMDGSDGLAGGMTLVGFGAYAFAGWLANDIALAVVCAALAAAAAAFLLYNFHPARIFLGDVGAIPLGFLAGALGIVGWRNDVWPLWFPLLVFAPFVGDATLTLLKRAVRGEKVWRAHREHYYQRMVRMGLGHRGTALSWYAVMAVCAAGALFARAQDPATQAVVLGAGAALLAGIAVWIDLRWARFYREGGATA